MNFFESQDIAKRNTGKLIFLFVAAVLSLIVITNLMVMLVISFSETGMTSMAATTRFNFSWELFLGIGAVVSAIVFIGSVYKISSLSGGGARIAEMMNGRLLVSGSENPAERRVMNVVEEMAIASGTPVPPVYVMEESGINAFAAGYSPSDAIIAVTRGSIENLSRDQLQGVIAHEFSHILHGDMRINIRLIGVLHGILVLGLIGHHLIRGQRHSHRSKNSGGSFAIGLGLILIGSLGSFFGNMIKAAVSRQREYLADASAVQFTRNPDGIGQALMQIARHHSHSHMRNPKSEEISHALFEEARVASFGRLHATHPPLEDRIRAILPRWDGDYEVSNWDRARVDAEQEQAEAEAAAPSNRDKAESLLSGVGGLLLADAMLSQMANPGVKHLEFAEALVHEIPPRQLAAAREPSSARAIVYLLLLNDSEPTRSQQLELIRDGADVGVYAELQNLLAAGERVEAQQRLALVTIALSSLRQLSKNQYQLFKSNFVSLIEIDRKVSLVEWTLQKIVFHHLDTVFDEESKPAFGKKNLSSCGDSLSKLLSLLAQSVKQDGISAEEAFSAGADKLENKLTFIDVAKITYEDLNGALDELVSVKPLQKPALLKALVCCISADGQIKPAEIELLRAISATIDCPVPPLLAG